MYTCVQMCLGVYASHIQNPSGAHEDSVVFRPLSMHSMHCVFFLNQHCPPILPLSNLFVESAPYRGILIYTQLLHVKVKMLWVCCVQRVVYCVMFSTVLSTHFLVTHVCCMCVVYSYSKTTLSEVFALSIISFISKMLVNCCVYSIAVYLLWELSWINFHSCHWPCSKVCVQPNWHSTSTVQQCMDMAGLMYIAVLLQAPTQVTPLKKEATIW